MSLCQHIVIDLSVYNLASRVFLFKHTWFNIDLIHYLGTHGQWRCMACLYKVSLRCLFSTCVDASQPPVLQNTRWDWLGELAFLSFFAEPHGMLDLSPWPGIIPVPPVVETRSLNWWTLGDYFKYQDHNQTKAWKLGCRKATCLHCELAQEGIRGLDLWITNTFQ